MPTDTAYNAKTFLYGLVFASVVWVGNYLIISNITHRIGDSMREIRQRMDDREVVVDKRLNILESARP